jgi:uncharacterized phage protein (TIGR02220 family)
MVDYVNIQRVITYHPNRHVDISENTTENTTENKEKYKKEIEFIINDFNKVYQTKYKPSNKGVSSNISARLKEGFTIEDFQHVHRVMLIKWAKTPQEEYLTPYTLYRPTKFPKYVNMKVDDSLSKKKDDFNFLKKNIQKSNIPEELQGLSVNLIDKYYE